MDLGLTDRVYVVAGGSRGLGLAVAQSLLAEGARVVLSGRGAEVQTTADALGGPNKAIGIIGDNADETTAGHLVTAAREHFGRLDGALISVGGPDPGAAMDVEDTVWRQAFETIFLGALRIARAVAVAAPGGSILFVLSSSVRAPIPGLAVSNGLRPGLGMLAKTLANELGPTGTRVNGLLPAYIATDRAKQLATLTADTAPTNSLRRQGTPLEVGHAATFILSPAASYITGTMIAVDGGAIPAL
ncbi:SDR family oxidoreductase [Mycolicibacterium komossense]|uniref:SDR family oxidoreductase n=1 Tax=Mycolicibacterium komossense TaxID=1779 RepID=A0ABT3CAZ5_9MYCO|nr:SDR family oxidoreductase [Mycolicibacterium komossense]MCV7226633.1 SDR family oxidoreductase [Mycolicibacterium komossense]